MKWDGITVNQIKFWERIYPDVDIITVIQYDIIRWLDKMKSTKKVRKVNWHKFISNWLKSEQSKRRLQ